MYPIQEDQVIRHSNGSITAFTKGQRFEISKDGSYKVYDRKNAQLIFQKKGKGS
jgi:hypothetical protein